MEQAILAPFASDVRVLPRLVVAQQFHLEHLELFRQFFARQRLPLLIFNPQTLSRPCGFDAKTAFQPPANIMVG
jgi:hypothetical protein